MAPDARVLIPALSGLLCLTVVAANAQTYRTGLVFAPNSEFMAIPPAPLLKKSRPPEFDLSKFAPPVGDQGDQNSCVGWAIAYAARTIVAEENGPHGAGPFSPSFVYNVGWRVEAARHPAGPKDCGTGMEIEDGLIQLRGTGVLPWKDFPYTEKACDRYPVMQENQAAEKYILAGWTRATSREDVLQSIALGGPVIFGFQFPESFRHYTGGIYKDTSSNFVGAHAVVVVGYSDSRKAFKS